MDYFKLIRTWFDFAFENPEKIKPNHIALYTFCVEHCNRLGWKKKFGLPTEMAKDAIGIRSYNTFINTLTDLIDFGFIIMIERSKNQYSSNIIALSNFDKALNKALDKASIKHITKQSESNIQSIDSIIKQLYKEQLNIKQINDLKKIISNYENGDFDFKKSFLSLGVESKILNDWLKVRKNKKATNSETAFENIKAEIDKSGMTANECIKISTENSWSGFKHSWVDQLNNTQSQQTKLDPVAEAYAQAERIKKQLRDERNKQNIL